MRTARYDDLIEKYENPIGHACDMREGQVFIANGWQRPENFCDSAWDTLSPFVMALAYGVWQEKKNYGKVSMGVVRSTYMIDENGVIEKVMPKVKPDTNAAEILGYLRERA